MPKIHNPPLLAPSKAFHHILHDPRDSLAPTIQDARIRIPLQGNPPSRDLDRLRRIMQPVQPHDIIPGLTQLVERIPGSLGKHRHRHGVDRQLLQPPRQLLGYIPQIRQRKVGEACRRELASPRVKHHDQLRARDDLSGEVLDAQAGNDVQQRLGLGTILVQPRLGVPERLAAPALDHVAQQRPGRAAEPDERDPALELLARQRDGLVDVVELGGHVDRLRDEASILGVGGRGERVREGRAFFRDHLDRHAHGLRDDEDVAEDDGRVDQVRVPVDRLQRERGRHLRRPAAGEEVVVAFRLVVFGEVAPGWGRFGGQDGGGARKWGRWRG
jgi:hypothetical protein